MIRFWRSSDEEDEEGALTEKLDNQFATILEKIRRKDPEIYKVSRLCSAQKPVSIVPPRAYDGTQMDVTKRRQRLFCLHTIEAQKETKFFSDEESEEESDSADEDDEEEKPKKKKKKEKPMYLKAIPNPPFRDVLAKQLIEDGPEGPEEDDPKVQRKLERKTQTKTYNDEQEDVRKAFLAAVDDADEDDDEAKDGLLKKKVKSKDEQARDAKEDKEIEEKLANKRKEDDAAKVGCGINARLSRSARHALSSMSTSRRGIGVRRACVAHPQRKPRPLRG
eukprot:1043889-Prorocentrum_minimum.AAC.3